MKKQCVDKLTVLAAEYLQAQDTDKSMTKYLKNIISRFLNIAGLQISVKHCKAPEKRPLFAVQ